jgi:hypothetical protein
MEPGELDEFHEILAAVRDGRLTDEQMDRLDLILASDPDARRYYLDYIELCANLRHYQGISSATPRLRTGEPAGFRRDRPPARRLFGSGRWRALRVVAAAAAAVVVAILATLSYHRPADRNAPVVPGPPAVAVEPTPAQTAPSSARPARPVEPESAEPQYVAVLTRVADPEWEPTGLPTSVGSALPAGRLRLRSGLAQLEFYGGAVVVLEGPADFELVGIDRAFCRQGKLRIRAPLHSSHFSVATPHADVVDLGTEFGVRVDSSGSSEVQVFEGSIELHETGRATPGIRQLLMGEGIRIDTNGVSLPTGVDPSAFVGARELARRTSTVAQSRYRAWRELSRSLQKDPRVVAYYTFEDQQRWERTLRDQSGAADARRDGGIVGCEWTAGRWPQKTALDFKRSSDRVRLYIPGEFDALTLMTWVRIDDFDNRLNSLLLSDGWGIPGEVHWELRGDGSIMFALKDGSPPGNMLFGSPAVLGPSQLGLWTHLATVFDPRNERMTTFVNGKVVAERSVRSDRRANIGWANIGNWSNPPPTDPADLLVRNLNGRIDEFIVFNHALDDLEIRSIYEVGNPVP